MTTLEVVKHASLIFQFDYLPLIDKGVGCDNYFNIQVDISLLPMNRVSVIELPIAIDLDDHDSDKKLAKIFNDFLINNILLTEKGYSVYFSSKLGDYNDGDDYTTYIFLAYRVFAVVLTKKGVKLKVLRINILEP